MRGAGRVPVRGPSREGGARGDDRALRGAVKAVEICAAQDAYLYADQAEREALAALTALYGARTKPKRHARLKNQQFENLLLPCILSRTGI